MEHQQFKATNTETVFTRGRRQNLRYPWQRYCDVANFNQSFQRHFAKPDSLAFDSEVAAGRVRRSPIRINRIGVAQLH